jgi:hypothetical protein
MENKVNLTDFLVETVEVKLPSSSVLHVDGLNVSTSPLRYASVVSDSDVSISDDDEYTESLK